MNECIFSTTKKINKCNLLNVMRCDPERCMWRKTESDMLASYHKARLNYLKTHGKDDYIKYVIPSWQDRYIAYENSIKDSKIADAIARLAETQRKMAENNVETAELKA